MTDLTPESAEAIHKAKNAQQAIELAREEQIARTVAETAARTKDALLEGLREVFGDSDSKSPEEMKVLVHRIPILCTNFAQVQKDIGEIKVVIKENNGDHEIRIRSIEKNMWKWMGVLLIIPPIVTIGIAFFINKMLGH